MLFPTLIAFLTLLTPNVLAVGPDKLTGSIQDVHDPTICKDSNGKYFLFSTAAGIAIRTSTDRTAWSYSGTMFPNGTASWTDQFTGTSNGILWAPDCTYRDGTFHVFYSASTVRSRHSAIFYATSTTGAPGNWTHRGLVHSTTEANNYNSIDPGLIIDGNNWILSLGSFWTGIKYMTLEPSTGMPTSPTVHPLAQRTANGGAVEASKIFKNGSFYYLFTSWDKCCSGEDSTYNIRVGRSSSATGPYADKDGVALTAGGGTLVFGAGNGAEVIGPGGQDVFMDKDGPILVYHHYTSDARWLGINRLDFSSGWPVVI